MCFKVKSEKPKKSEKREKPETQPEKPVRNSHWHKPLGTIVKQSKSRELRASVLYVNCDCEKRNGLQDDCQRMECHGSPECLTHPPTCGPSAFASGKHLEKKMRHGKSANAKGEKSSGSGASGGDVGDGFGSEDMQYCCIPLCRLFGNT